MSAVIEKQKLIRAGKKSFLFVPAGYQDGVYDCTLVCHYSKICHLLPDPREPKNPDRRFIDFCGSIGVEDKNISGNLIPSKGTIEENSSDDKDWLKILLENGYTVMADIREIRDDVCKDGYCSHYKKGDYSGCRSDNAGCVLARFFRNRDLEAEEEKILLSLKEFNTTDAGVLKENDKK